jgi:hypothetical protein
LENGCVQLTSKVGKNRIEIDDGLWKDVPCNKRNLVVCQKGATLSIPEIQAALFELKNNPVPVGFIYTQLPNKPSPQTIWPNLVWKNVTSEYAGLFFRAEGGTAGEFGEEQGESTKRLRYVSNTYRSGEIGDWGNEELVAGQWTSYRNTGRYGTNSGSVLLTYQMDFYMSNDEVKPRNTAVRIWERVQ